MNEFVTLVAAMRTAQKAYFAGRSPVDLAESKRLERLVDAAVRDRQDGQAKLFEGEL